MKNKRVTYTIPKNLIEFIDDFSEIKKMRKSNFVSMCIESSYKFLDEELEEYKNGFYDELYSNGKKIFDTKPITLSLPLSVVEKLNFYSSELGVKKSHLVFFSIVVYSETLQRELDSGVEELMRVGELS